MAEMTASQLLTKCKELKDLWTVRNSQFAKWYDLLLLDNNLAQEDMESVITNDPRTQYNLGLHMLTSSTISHKITTAGLDQKEIEATSYLEAYTERQWERMEQSHRRLGKQSWLREFVGFMLATGWYSIFVLALPDRLIAEIWNPSNVFQRFGPDGLEACVHIYHLTANQANRKAKTMGWTLTRPIMYPIDVYNYWEVDNDGDPANAILLGTDNLVKPLTKLAGNEQKSKVLPIFTSPVAGLPDMGSIKSGSKDWQRHYGEGIVAVNADEFLNRNKMETYCQQLVRDTANPRWFERSRSQKGILQPEAIFKRGAIFRGTPEESVEALPMPAIPIELRTILFDYDNRIQRGGFAHALHGNIQQTMSSYLASQIAAASLSVLTPYANAVKGVLSDVDNYWLYEIRERKLSPHGFKIPPSIPKETEFGVDFNINIPGSLVQRATLARMVDPSFQLDFATTCDMVFPEIKDPVEVQAKVNKDNAMTNPIAQILGLIAAYKEQARFYNEAGDKETANLFLSAVAALEAQLPQTPAQGPSPGGMGPEPSKEVTGTEMVAPAQQRGQGPEMGGMLGQM